MFTRTVVMLGLLLLLLPACSASRDQRAQAMSLLGRALYPMELEPEVRREREAALAAARARYEEDPADEEAIIWLGRRQAYLGLYREAIETFTEGLRLHPESARLLRHRGHRYITVRDFDRAVDDLERAAMLVADQPDAVEPDGQPNARNMPRSTLKTNIYYHLGLAHDLLGRYDAALAAWQRCLELSPNDDMVVASIYWMELVLHRLDEQRQARALLARITPGMDVIENQDYLDLLLLFKGRLAPEAVLDPEDAGDIASATTGYGVAMWHMFQGETRRGRELLERVVAGPAWAAFGHIAAEAELARRGNGQ